MNGGWISALVTALHSQVRPPFGTRYTSHLPRVIYIIRVWLVHPRRRPWNEGGRMQFESRLPKQKYKKERTECRIGNDNVKLMIDLTISGDRPTCLDMPRLFQCTFVLLKGLNQHNPQTTTTQ